MNCLHNYAGFVENVDKQVDEDLHVPCFPHELSRLHQKWVLGRDKKSGISTWLMELEDTGCLPYCCVEQLLPVIPGLACA